MKVCFISEEYPPNLLGGAGVYAYELTRAVSRLGVETHVLAPNHQTRTERKDNLFIHWQKTIFKPFLRLPSFLYSVKKNLGKIIQKHHVELIHANTYAGFHGADKLPIIATVHSLEESTKNANLLQKLKMKPYYRMENEILKKSKKIISVSHLIRNFLIAKDPDLEKKIIIVNEGVDTRKFRRDYDADFIRKKFGIEREDILLLHPGGAMSEGKGALYLLAALKKLKREYNVKCIFNGASREIRWKRVLFEEIRRNELVEAVIFSGNVEYDDMPKYYCSSDIVVYPSLFEGYGLVPLEAMACEKPVITTKTGELPYLIKNMENGILIGTKDVEALYEKIKLLIENVDLRLKFAKNGRNFVERNLSWSVIGEKVKEIYTSVI